MNFDIDTIIPIIGTIAGIIFGIWGIYQRMDDTKCSVFKKRIKEEKRLHDLTREILKKYEDLYGPLKKDNDVKSSY